MSPIIAKAMTEKQLSQLVFDAARKLGWLVARYPTWKPTGTTPGFPDLVMVSMRWKKPRLIFAELKSERASVKPSGTQAEWLSVLKTVASSSDSIFVCVWRPSDWLDGTIANVLAGERRS